MGKRGRGTAGAGRWPLRADPRGMGVCPNRLPNANGIRALWAASSTSNHWAPSSAWLLLCKVTADPLSTAPHTQPRCSCNLQLAFMPPEAFDDDAAKLNEKLDVYSMGVCGERTGSGWVSVLGAEEFVRGAPPFRANAGEGGHVWVGAHNSSFAHRECNVTCR